MPLLVPLFSWITWTPRYIHKESPSATQPAPQQEPVKNYPEPTFSVAKRA